MKLSIHTKISPFGLEYLQKTQENVSAQDFKVKGKHSTCMHNTCVQMGWNRFPDYFFSVEFIIMLLSYVQQTNCDKITCCRSKNEKLLTAMNGFASC